MENIALAHKNARRGKLHYKEVKAIDKSPTEYFKQIQDMIKNKTFQNSEYERFVVLKGKRREISKLPYFPDRIIHHCIMQVVGPIWMKTLISDTFSCIKGRGIHKAADRLKTALMDKVGTSYCLKCDVKQFYPSVDHVVLKRVIRRKIKDRDLLWLLDMIIDSAPGIPIGNYLSQQFGNLYLSGLDRWIKETKMCKYYFRYCDDMVILHHDKAFLARLRKDIEQYLDCRLNVVLKENWQIFPVESRGIDFLGYRFFHNYILLRKSTATNFKRKMRKIKQNWQRMWPIEILSSVMSYYGWLKYANCLHLTNKFIDKEILKIVNVVCYKNNLNNPTLRIAEMSRET